MKALFFRRRYRTSPTALAAAAPTRTTMPRSNALSPVPVTSKDPVNVRGADEFVSQLPADASHTVATIVVSMVWAPTDAPLGTSMLPGNSWEELTATETGSSVSSLSRNTHPMSVGCQSK